jgi:toxin ParE1/3/4
MSHNVIVLPEAKDDLVEIYLHVAECDSIGKADALLGKLEERCLSLGSSPERGHVVPELKRIHVEGFREVHFKPYRFIYQVISKKVYIHAVLDGRRELQELLERRVLR